MIHQSVRLLLGKWRKCPFAYFGFALFDGSEMAASASTKRFSLQSHRPQVSYRYILCGFDQAGEWETASSACMHTGSRRLPYDPGIMMYHPGVHYSGVYIVHAAAKGRLCSPRNRYR
jgi:hypothetical protein